MSAKSRAVDTTESNLSDVGTPRFGDRMLIRGIPEDYPYKMCYNEVSVVAGINDDGVVAFASGYLPYKDGDSQSLSGSYHYVPKGKVNFVERKPALFWRFKDGEMRAHNGENYELGVNWFECNFNDLG